MVPVAIFKVHAQVRIIPHSLPTVKLAVRWIATAKIMQALLMKVMTCTVLMGVICIKYMEVRVFEQV